MVKIFSVFLFTFSILFSVFFFTDTAYSQDSQIKIRVLLVDPKNPVLPKKDEKLEKMDSKQDAHVLVEGAKFSGKIDMYKGERGIYVVNEMPLEDYLKGVIVAEVGSNWDAEALKAQAVAARTYAIYQMQNASRSVAGYHLTSSVLHQVYKSGSVPEAIFKAVDDTRSEVLTYEGKPIIAYYHSTSGGMTEDPIEVFGKEYPYLKAVETNSELSPYFMWERKIPLAEVEKALEISGIKDIIVLSLTASSRLKDLKIVNTTKEVIILAKDFRRKIGWEKLPSTLITNMSIQDDRVVFEGRGYGHGVGLCQWSSLLMAKEGKTYREILQKFYPGAQIEHYAVQ
ncbi:MAG: SpoIID/LytB domain-containing protein [Dissulfurispiraceae bacterium]|nr:SpoIID/LytB domain-containing protein [Dissulfurispiraceae bacterium]